MRKLRRFDESMAVDVVYMYFNKTVDKDLHGRLVQKVKAHGIQGKVVNGIQSWFGDRTAVMELCFSVWKSVTRGVPEIGTASFAAYNIY